MVSFIRFVGGSCICTRGTRASLLSLRLSPVSLHGSLFLRSSGLQHLRFKKTRQKLYNDEAANPPTSARRGETPIQGQAFKVLLVSAEEKMTGSVAHYEKQMAVLESRAIGRVMPSLIEGVKVPNLLGDVRYKLRDVASIGVKEGTTLVVTVFEPSVSDADRCMYSCKI
jgi:ribosome recycling factor